MDREIKNYFTVIFYENTNGKQPAREFIKGLEKEDQKEIGSDIRILQQSFPVGLPLVRRKTMKGIGQNFDDFLNEQGILNDVNELAAKKLITYQLMQAMEEQKLTKSSIAKKMKTSRVAIDNILDPAFNTSIESLERFAQILGKRLTISLT